ncbi:hypothetical protein K525DRAFT_199068 [Schizophyllum commune Loenen D]|nr:hypothetical protein K525DRAFT_199068 [Schizophyllum commune Loenen D]
MRHIHARNAQLEYESKFTLDLPNCSTLWRPHTLDVNSAIRYAIRHSPLGYLPFPHSDPPNLDRALHSTKRIDPATALPFEIVSKIFVHVYEAAPPSVKKTLPDSSGPVYRCYAHNGVCYAGLSSVCSAQ